MDKFVIDKIQYRIRYQHVIKGRDVNNRALEARFAKDLKKRKAVTVATVERAIYTECRVAGCTSSHAEWVKVAEGVAFCGKKDNFSKAVGREVALANLIESMLAKGFLYLAGRILHACGSDDRNARFVAELKLTLVMNKRSGLALVYASDEGIGRIRLGKADLD